MKRYEDLSELQRLWFLSLALTDLQQARLALALADAYTRQGYLPHAREVYACLHDAVVTRYVRPFLGCRLPDENRKTLLPAEVVYGDNIPVEHDQIKRMRDQIVAHSDMTNKDVRATRRPDTARGPEWIAETSTDLWDSDQLQRVFSGLLDRAIARVHELVSPLMRARVENRSVGEVVHLRELLIPAVPPSA